MKKRESVKKKKEAPLTGAKKRKEVLKAAAKKRKETPQVKVTFGNDDESEIEIDNLTKGTPMYYGENESYDYGWKNDKDRQGDMNIPTSISHHTISDDVSVISMGRSIAPDDASVMSDRTDARSRTGGYKLKPWDEGGLNNRAGLPKRDQADLKAEYNDLMDIVAQRAKGGNTKGAFPSAKGAFPSDATQVHANTSSAPKDTRKQRRKKDLNVVDQSVTDPTEPHADTPKHPNSDNTSRSQPVRKNTGSTVDESQPGTYANSPGRSSGRASHQAFSMVLRAEENQPIDVYGDDGGASDTVSDVIPNWYNNMARNNTSSNGQLPVAGMVDNNPNMQQTQQVGDDSQNSNSEGRKSPPSFVALLAIALIIGGVLLALFLMRDSSSSNSDETTGNLRSSSAPSLGPTPSPTLSAERRVLTLLPDDTIRAINNRPSGSQAKAYEWLVEDINLILPDSLSDDRLMQRFAMATFYHATEGPFWSRSDDWLNHSLHECQWYSLGSFDEYIDGIIFIDVKHNSTCEVDPEDVLPNMKLQDDGILQHIWLPYNNVGGTFPQELFGLLTNLRSINLDGGHVSGTLPAEVSKLTNLEALSLQANKLESTIPSTISSLTKLSTFTTAYNDLHGSVPTELGLLTDLRYLVLDTNPKMLGALPTEIFLLTDLVWFSVGKMGLTGTIPSEIALMTNLDYLLVSHNLLTGKLPSEVGNLQQLLGIDVSRNHFFGPIPSELGILTSMDVLSMFDNHFTGTVPTELGLLTALVSLDLEDNTLMGSIPSQLGRLSNMEELWLSGNFLSGTIPTEFGNYPTLVALILESNSLSGSIPSQLGLLSSMAVLQLQFNALTGTVPEELALPPILTAVDLRENDLTGEIPEDLCSIQSLEFNCSSNLCGCDCLCNVVLINSTTDDGTIFSIVFDDDSVSEAAPSTLASNGTTTSAASETFNSNNTTTESSNSAPMNELLAGWGGSAINGTTSNSTRTDNPSSEATVPLPISVNDGETNVPSV